MPGVQNIYVLILLLLIPALGLLFYWLLGWKKKTIRRIGDEKLVSQLIRTHSPFLFALRFIIICLALVAGIIGLSNPRTPDVGEGVSRKGIDIAIALDVSKSMLAQDISPNRLEQAKNFIIQLLSEMPDERVALVLFAGKAYLQMPLTTDHPALDIFINTANPYSMPQPGTNLSDAMKISSLAFNNQERRFKTIILITDGEAHDPDYKETAEELAELGTMVNTIGIGSPQGSTIIDSASGQPRLDGSGNPVISKLNEQGLKEIAAITSGKYIQLNDPANAVQELKQHLSGIERVAFTDISMMNFKSFYWWFALAMFVLIISELFIPEKRKVKA